MKLATLVAAAAVVIATCTGAAAQSSKSSVPGANTGISQVDKYRVHTYTAITFCAMEVDTMLALKDARMPHDTQDIADCVKRNNANSRPLMREAVEAVESPGAKEALKEYQLALMTALDGLMPGQGERRFAYEARIQRLQGEVQRAWNRVLLEL